MKSIYTIVLVHEIFILGHDTRLIGTNKLVRLSDFLRVINNLLMISRSIHRRRVRYFLLTAMPRPKRFGVSDSTRNLHWGTAFNWLNPTSLATNPPRRLNNK